MYLSLENFGLWKEKKTILFPEKPGIYLVHGRNEDDSEKLEGNGIGKTQLFSALSFCFFGVTPEGQKASQIAYDKKKPIIVTTEWNGHTIERRTSPGTLLIDGQNATQDELQHLIRLTPDEWKSTVHFCQDIYTFIDWSANEQSLLMGNVLELDRWTRYSSSANEVSKNFNNRQVELSSTLEKNVLTIAHNEQFSEQLKKDVLSLDERLKEIEQEQIESFNEDVSNLKIEKDKLTTQIAYLKNNDHKKTFKELKSQRDNYLQEKKITEYHANQKTKQIDALKKESYCNECGQPILVENAEEIIKTCEKDILNYSEKIKAIDSMILELNSQEETIQKALDLIEKQIESTSQDYYRVSEQIRQIESRKEEIAKRKRQLESSIKSYKNEINEKLGLLETLSSKNDELLKENTNIELEIKEITHLKTLTDMWSVEFKNIRTFLLEEVLETLTELTNEYLSELMSGWSIVFSTNKELASGENRTRVSFSVQSPDGFVSDLSNWSGGIKDRLRLATSMAFSDYILAKKGLSVPYEIYDESTKFFSKKGVEAFFRLLKKRAISKGISIFVISHTGQELSFFDGEIYITKKGGMVSDCEIRQF